MKKFAGVVSNIVRIYFTHINHSSKSTYKYYCMCDQTNIVNLRLFSSHPDNPEFIYGVYSRTMHGKLKGIFNPSVNEFEHC